MQHHQGSTTAKQSTEEEEEEKELEKEEEHEESTANTRLEGTPATDSTGTTPSVSLYGQSNKDNGEHNHRQQWV